MLKKEKQIKLYLLTLTTLFIISFALLSVTAEESEIPTCGDGTLYRDCSLNKPYFCDNGILAENVPFCGCSEISNASGDSCIFGYKSYPEIRTFRYFLDGEEHFIDVTLYGEAAEQFSKISRSIEYTNGQQPLREDFKKKVISNEAQKELIMPLVVKIQNLDSDKTQQARIAISLVQNIPYGSIEKSTPFAGSEVNYSQYPYEVLYYNQGICGEKSALLAFLLKELGYNTAIFYFAEENHEAVGVSCPVEKSYKNTGYCFVETGGPSIIADSALEYVNGIKLESEPQVIPISEGISLPSDLKEYRDSKDLKDIRNRNFFGLLKFYRFGGIKSRYGLVEEYGLE